MDEGYYLQTNASGDWEFTTKKPYDKDECVRFCEKHNPKTLNFQYRVVRLLVISE